MSTNREERVEEAVAAFRKLLNEQLDRKESMEQQEEPADFASRPVITIGILDGDGIGPIIMKEAVKVLETVLEKDIKAGKVILKSIPGLTIENRIAQNAAVPADVLEVVKQCDVLLKGPTTTPKGGTLESANVCLRRELDLYANVRPVCVPEEGIDWIFFRENTEGEYVLGSRGIKPDDGLTMDFKVITKPGTERIARAAYRYAKQNGKNHVSVVTKANIMKKTDGMFSEICHNIAEEYPDITTEDYYVDIMSANLVNEKTRNRFQVFLLPNLYGDILTDEAAQIQGGVGTAGSANIGDRYAMFEAIHGSGLRMMEEGRGMYANPSSVIRASEMLLRHIGRMEEADRIAKALEICTETEKKVVITGRSDGATCEEFGSYFCSKL